MHQFQDPVLKYLKNSIKIPNVWAKQPKLVIETDYLLNILLGFSFYSAEFQQPIFQML